MPKKRTAQTLNSDKIAAILGKRAKAKTRNLDLFAERSGLNPEQLEAIQRSQQRQRKQQSKNRLNKAASKPLPYNRIN